MNVSGQFKTHDLVTVHAGNEEFHAATGRPAHRQVLAGTEGASSGDLQWQLDATFTFVSGMGSSYFFTEAKFLRGRYRPSLGNHFAFA